MNQEMTGSQWHQLDYIQIICTMLQTDNHASTSSLNFYRPDALPDAQSTEGDANECPVILNQLVIRVTEFFRCYKKNISCRLLVSFSICGSFHSAASTL